MSKAMRSALFGLLVVLSILSLATMGCGGTDGDGGSFLDDVIEGEKQNWSEVGESIKGPSPSSKDSGFVGSAGKFICESRGHTWVASISACYEK